MNLKFNNFMLDKVYFNELEMVKNIVKYEMEHAVELNVPFTVEMNAAGNWLDAH